MAGVPRKPDEENLFAEIRANIVFEKMIVSILIATGLSAAAHFLLALAVRISAGGISIEAIGSLILNAIFFAAFFFLAGFAASVAIGIPLFKILEKSKFQKAWPYCAAALAVSFLILLAAGSPPSIEAPWRVLLLAPGLAAALLFARRMRPFWEAAARRERETQDAIIRLH
ncbi:MAG: hypothetical protein KDD85_02910 [Parvularculaceae bacterium]|nr:hypothetical protein [Parvularculaceae bacterium]